jgi:hypothetical protein
MAWRLCRVIAWLAILPSIGCSQPVLTGFEPAQGPPRSIASATGTDLVLAGVVWDAGLATERVLPTSLNGPMFSVPADATSGPHPVALQIGNKRTAPKNFVVTGTALQLGRPRIDSVMSLSTRFDSSDVNAVLYVQGANFDVGAVVLANGDEIATVAHKGLINELHGIPPALLGFPIHHYVAVLAMPGARPVSTELALTVRNQDGATSEPFTFVLPASEATLDSDGDSLLDSWEQAGHDVDGDGASDVDKYRKDILVELDVMAGVSVHGNTAAGPGTLEIVRAMFRRAPVLNPFTSSGINLAIDASGSVPAKDTVVFDDNGQPVPEDDLVVSFSTLKSRHFDHQPFGDMYHYVVWAARQAIEESGQSDYPWTDPDPAPGDDAIVSLAALGATYQTTRSQAEVLAHELGHNLAQRHGGRTHAVFNPNYWSVMSYTWVLRTSTTVVARRRRVTCLPMYYGKAGVTEGPSHQVPAQAGVQLDYSAGMAMRVVENNGSLNETTGVCGHAVDWDEDGTMGGSSSLSVDANDNGENFNSIDDFANWPALRLDGPSRNGTIP